MLKSTRRQYRHCIKAVHLLSSRIDAKVHQRPEINKKMQTLKKSHIDMAERIAISNFDKWNEVSGFIEPHSGTYSEILSIIEDAVHAGIQMAMFGNIETDENGQIKRK